LPAPGVVGKKGSDIDLAGSVRLRREREIMKRIRLLVLLGAVAVALPLGLIPAKATGTTNSVTIQQYADYDAAGFVLDVGLYVRCKRVPGNLRGTVIVNVQQYPPQTPAPVSFGSGPTAVVCDGNTHAVGVTIVGEGFDAGYAKATATLTPPPGGGSAVTAQRWITIVVV
jgi:hypothetical protein